MRTRGERRELRNKKIKQRENILKTSGFRQGTLFEKHEAKIKEKGTGFMSKHGSLLHFANGTSRTLGKTRNRNSYSGTNNWKARDMKQINSMNDKEKEERY